MVDKYGAGQDPNCYAGTDVLKNLLNLTDPKELDAAERDLTATIQDDIEFELPPYDLPLLKRIHQQLFQDIYPWAGQIRTVDMAKGSTRFCNVERIEPEAQKLFEQLETKQWFENYTRDTLVSAMAEFYGDLNVIHPFREGIGRVGRILCEFIAINAGFEVDWSPVDSDQWLKASIDSVGCDYRTMESVFGSAIATELGA